MRLEGKTALITGASRNIALLTVSGEDWLRVFSVNLHSCFYLSKAALPNMTERRTGSNDATRRHPEWAPHNPNMEQATPEALQAIPLGRLGMVQDIAEACLFLASDDSS